MTHDKSHSVYFDGKKLYGDDFSFAEIESWYADEKEGYANLGASEKSRYSYSYHALNWRHGFRCLGNRRFKRALGLGSAYGDEFIPLSANIEHLTIIDPSDAFAQKGDVHGIPCEYHKPEVSGDLKFADDSFDLIVCLGVLHHIPNVSHVINECYRCLKPGGVFIVREPIISMGDWTKPRSGLTKRERGIPLGLFRDILDNAGFKVLNSALCFFPLVPKLANKLKLAAYNNRFLTELDYYLSRIFGFNYSYHAEKAYKKFRPTSAIFVLEK